MRSRLSYLTAPALAGATALFLTACQGDSPTGVPSDGATAPIAAFPMASGVGHAVAAATNQMVRVFPTLAILAAKEASFGAADAHVNSPWDLTNLGGRVVTHATSHNIYVNCASTPAGCWGTGSLSPATFLRDLDFSSFLAIANQYTGHQEIGQFGVAELALTTTFTNHTASVNDILGIVFSASEFTGASGYDHIFHVFLPKGTDVCLSATDCYSPDNPSTFKFCAFHASVDFSPTQHVLFSVEPYQFVSGCALPQQTRVIDATASALSHEFFETITDPDGGTWVSLLTGNEIGDLCFAFRNPEFIGRRNYVIQEEYSNRVHDCTDRPTLED